MKKLSYYIRIVVGALFISAAIGKGLFFNTFVNEINYYSIIPYQYGMYAAYLILASEIAIGILLMAGKYIKAVSYSGINLIVIFIAVKTSVIIRGIDLVDCKCFGTLLSLPLWFSYTLGITIIIMLVIGYLMGRENVKQAKKTV